MRLRLSRLLLAASLSLSLTTAMAEEKTDHVGEALKQTQSFLDAHPDLKYRQLGLSSWREGDYETALKRFKRAAKYADKPSQGMVAEMLWRGDGVPQNRVEAYAWMDLAAERQYRPMLIQREIYWGALTPAEREAAIAIGKGLYAEYGDDVAQRRTEHVMRRARKKTVGSRTGFGGNVTITIPTPGGMQTIDGSTYYSPDYWEADRYWAWQEKGWKNPPRGMVDVGPLTSAEKPAEPAEPDEKK
jgi:hypothetical protein